MNSVRAGRRVASPARQIKTVHCLLAAALMASPLLAQSAREIVQTSQDRTRANSEHYEGVLTVIDSHGKTTTKRWIYDRIGSFGNSKAILRFTDPPEVKGVALLIINHPDRASDQWMWRPAIERDTRVALQDRSTRFFGTGFSFEDLEERDVDQFDYALLNQESMDGAPCWKIVATPKQAKSSQYTRTFLWIRKDNYVLAMMQGWSKNRMTRSIHYTNIARVQDIWTARRLEVWDAERRSTTVLTLDKLQYNTPMREQDFTVEALRRLG
ncbi:MAG TPA: outer membrane lipoprotein-sorting protein [Bryobacteraceae bacterium]|nr:outer membrane lipoprotein-sorting protein [Bryobacteraceae bacterium]